jgi:mono/diheme cytochrome c family protein
MAMLVLLVATAISAQVPTLTLPTIGGPPPAFGADVTVLVDGVVAPPPRKSASAKDLAEGKKLYAQRCALCHGDAGAADGVGARRIRPEPQHLNDVIWQGAVSDAEIEKAILEGGAAVSRSPMMPSNPDLKKKPALVKALVAYVRSLRAPYGSVTASATVEGSDAPVVMRADADASGKAKVVFSALPKGKKVAVSVMVDEGGKVGCTLNLAVTRDTSVPCPKAAP